MQATMRVNWALVASDLDGRALEDEVEARCEMKKRSKRACANERPELVTPPSQIVDAVDEQ